MFRFEIYDVIHCDSISQHDSLADAWAQLRILSVIPWNAEPNVAPCASWEDCGREYVINEYDTTTRPWILLRTHQALSISRAGIRWVPDAPESGD